VSKPAKVALHTVALTHKGSPMRLTVTSVEVPSSDGDEPVLVIDTVSITPQSGHIDALISALNVDTLGNRKLLDMLELGSALIPPLTLPPKPMTSDLTGDKAKAEAIKYFDAVMGRLFDHVYSAARACASDNAIPTLSGFPFDEFEASSYELAGKLCALAALDTGLFSFGWQELRMVGVVIDDAVSVLRRSFSDLNLQSWSYVPLQNASGLKCVEALYYTLIESKEVSDLLGAKGISGLQSTLDRMSGAQSITNDVERREGIYASALLIITALSKHLCIQPSDAQAPPFTLPHFLSVVPRLLRNAPQRKEARLAIERILRTSPLKQKDVDDITRLLASSAAAGIHFDISDLISRSSDKNSALLEPLRSYQSGLVPEPTEPVAENLIKTLQKVVDTRGIKSSLVVKDMAWRKARVELPDGETIVGNRLYNKGGEYTVGIWVSCRMFVCWVELPQDLSSTGECSWLVFYVVSQPDPEVQPTEVQRGYEVEYGGASDSAVVPTEGSVMGKVDDFEVFTCSVLIQPDKW
jgi:hypothetical protein